VKHFILLAALLLAACGGGGSSAPAVPGYAVKMMTRLAFSGPVPADPGFNASAIGPRQWADVPASVAQQAAAPVDALLLIGPRGDLSGLPAYLAEAAKYPGRFPWVYLYDELGWEGGAVALGARWSDVEAAAATVHAAGLQAAVSILPDVILAPGFTPPAGLDVIAVDVYPSGRGTPTIPPGCATSANPYTDLLACSVQRLRAAGFHGQVWYIYEAFGNSAEPDLAAKLLQQRQTIAAGPALGVSGLVAYGYIADPAALPPPLYQGKSSPIDALVNCSWGC
jgi:hypothetical protein